MKPGIKIKVIIEPDDDGLYKYQITLCNGQSVAALDFWGYNDTFKEFGSRLINFPNGLKEIVTYELGEDRNEGSKKSAYYLLISIFCFDASGQSAIKVVIDNHATIPEYQRNEFYIYSEPSFLNSLGQRLANWSPESEKELVWLSSEPG